MGELKDLQDLVVNFRDDREWEEYHTPKNLAMAIGSEVGELQDLLLWDREPDLHRLAWEMADILIYLLSMADVTQIDLYQAVKDKLAINEQKYPVAVSRGNCDKANSR